MYVVPFTLMMMVNVLDWCSETTLFFLIKEEEFMISVSLRQISERFLCNVGCGAFGCVNQEYFCYPWDAP